MAFVIDSRGFAFASPRAIIQRAFSTDSAQPPSFSNAVPSALNASRSAPNKKASL